MTPKIDIFDRHNEIFHYTSIDSAMRIIESNSLFATKFTDLNDRTEMKLLKQKMEEKLLLYFLDLSKKIYRTKKNPEKIDLGKKSGWK